MKDISRRSVILGAAAITAGCAAQGTSGLVAPAATRSAAGGSGMGMAGVDQVLRQAIGPDKVAGLVATVGTDKETLFEAAYGKRSLDGEVDMSADSVFWIASMTKAVTCTAAMQMVEQGRLTLDDPIGGVLPELGSPRVLTGSNSLAARPL